MPDHTRKPSLGVPMKEGIDGAAVIKGKKQQKANVKRNPPPQGTTKQSGLDSIFITGYSLRAPKSNNAAEFYANLVTKNDMVDTSLRYPRGYLGLPNRAGHLPDIEHFDNHFFKMNPKQVDKTEIGIRLSLECAKEALMDAMIPMSIIRGSATGVYVGCCETDFATRSIFDENKVGYEMVNGARSMMANRISYFFDLKGPSLVLDTACSSSLVALDIARQDILLGKIDRAIVIGANLTLDPHKNACFNAFQMLSPDGTCHTFDKRANGYCRSEGIFAIVVESSSICARGGYAKLLSTAVNSDGLKRQGITFPSGSSQCENGQNAFEQSGISPGDIAYIEAHGTGTTAGDAEELEGFVELFYGASLVPRNIPIGSVKSCMGHAEGASGLASIIKCLLMMEKRVLLPNLHFKSTAHKPILNHFFDVVTEVEPWEPGFVCVSNYGFGGTNAFAILEPGNVVFDTPTSPENGAASHWRFGNQSATAVLPGADVDNSLSKGTQRWFQQQVLLGNERGFGFRNNRELSDPEVTLDTIAFIFGGQGSQWLNMGKCLYNESNIFHDTIDRLDNHIAELLMDFTKIVNIPSHGDKEISLSFSLVELYKAGDRWLSKDFAALGVISYQVAIINIMKEIGVTPNFVLGHSMGEVSAAYAAGIQSERETIGVALTRSLAVSKMTGESRIFKSVTARSSLEKSELPSPISTGGDIEFYYYLVPVGEDLIMDPERGECIFDLHGVMAAVGQDASTIEKHIEHLNLQQTCVACFNSAKGQTVSGPKIEVQKLFESMSKESPDLFWRDINTDGLAFHSPLWECFEGLMNMLLQNVFKVGTVRQWKLPWLSTSELDPLYYGDMTEFDIVKYHIKNITRPVFFQTAIEALPRNCLVIEVGSSQSLLSQVKRARKGGIGVLGFVKNNSPLTEEIFSRASAALDIHEALWEAGFNDEAKSRKSKSFTAPFVRVSAEDRYPHLWDHTTSHRIFTWEDYAKIAVDGKAKLASSTTMALVDEVLHISEDYLLCRVLLSTSSHNWIKDHRIEGSVVFPGVAYLEMILQAALLLWPIDTETVRNVIEAKIKMLFLSDNDTAVYTELIKNQEDESMFDASIYTFQDKKKTVHFSCKICHPAELTRDENIPSSWLADQGMPTQTSRLTKSYIYKELLSGLNFAYGETFQLLQFVDASEVRARGEIDIRSVMEREVGTYFAHPCMLDDALHVLFPLLKTFSKSFVPVEFNEVVYFEKKTEGLSTVQADVELLEIGGSFQYYVFKVQIKDLISLKVTVKPLEQKQSDYNLFERVLVPAQLPLPAKTWTEWQNVITEKDMVVASHALTVIMQEYVRNALNADEAETLIAREETLGLHVRRMISLAREGYHDMGVFTEKLPLSPSEMVAKIAPYDLEMVNRVGQNLLRIWQNPKVAQEVLFHDDLMTNVYRGGCIFQEREAMRAKLAVYGDVKGLRVLEIGAGTGGLTEIALEVLSESTDYVFSDISPSFFGQARERWGDRITCQIVDIGGDRSGFDEMPYDLIIGFDVIHATSNIGRTMQNLKDMLVPGGSMVVMDLVGCSWWAEMCFGAFEGWFLFEDDYRDKNCYLDQSAWQHLAETIGFNRFTIEHHGVHCVLGFGKTIETKEDFDISIDNELQLIDYVKRPDFEEKKHHSLRLSASSREENALLVGFIRSLREEYPTHVFATYIADFNCADVEVTTSGDLAKERFIKFEPSNHCLDNHPNGTSFKQSFETRMLLPPSSELGVNEVKIRILFSSLNFQDVAIDLKLIDIPRDRLGFELYGEIVSSSKDSKFEIGDHVVGYAMHNFATSTCIVESTALVKVINKDLEIMSPQQMVANLVYITAFYTKRIANIVKTDTVLIHSATGGFGLSCVHLCKRIGCNIVATAGTEEKRRYLENELQIEHVFDSRGDWFTQLCSSSLGEASINVVINSLAGNQNIKNGILSLAPMGRFCEVGKKDIYDNPWFDRSVFKIRPCISLHYIDMGYVLSGDCFKIAEDRGRFIEELMMENEWITCDPLPIQEVFPISALSEAAQTMAKGTHIGRFLLDHTVQAPPKPIASVAPQYPPNGRYIISGGLGGLGIALAEYLCTEADAESVTLLSRRGKASVIQKLRLKAIHHHISIVKCDVTEYEDVASLRCEVAPHAIFHLAVKLIDKAATELSAADLASVHGPKIKGLENLYEIFPSCKHVVFSSVAGILGNFHQAAYSAASQWVEGFARSRPNIHILNVNCVTDVGEIAETPGLYATMKRKEIISDVQSLDVFKSVNWLLASDVGQLVMLAPTNYSKLCMEGRISERYESDTKNDDSKLKEASLPGSIAAIVMGELNLKKFDSALKLTSYGLDSLSSVVIVKKLEKIGIEISSIELMRGVSADELVEKAQRD